VRFLGFTFEDRKNQMKRKIKFIIVAFILIVILILFLPIPKGTYDDGGTRVYDAFLYKIVVWNRIEVELNEDGSAEQKVYDKTSVFWFPDNYKYKTYEELWELESQRQ